MPPLAVPPCTELPRMSTGELGKGQGVSASSHLVGFCELNDNTIKGLISLLSVEHEIEFIAYTCDS